MADNGAYPRNILDDDESDLSELEEGETPPPPSSENLARAVHDAESRLTEPPTFGLSTKIPFPRDKHVDDCRGWCQCEKGCAWAEKTPAHLNSTAIDSMPVPLSSERSTQLPARTIEKGNAPPLIDEESRNLARAGKFDDREAWATSIDARDLMIELGSMTSVADAVKDHEAHVKTLIHMFNVNFPPAYEELRMIKVKGETMYGKPPKMEQLRVLLTDMLDHKTKGVDLKKEKYCSSFADIVDGHPELVVQFRSLAFMAQDQESGVTGKSETGNRKKQWAEQQQQLEQQVWQDWRNRLPFTDDNMPKEGNLSLNERYEVRRVYAERLLKAIEDVE
ncbi:hypothetical protein K431DRAFT_297181 [Polychaeton citri CBS 116435]|uniref:Uncharacterized protein n=1 Tax=Polychaeton citri CBS 116435 TaxID=1314669 RepID=A0A9P4Q026_9PEZI|nr:hypothetical protein K431DRAFT_297181 [Polychaeton citri CBS 116435]